MQWSPDRNAGFSKTNPQRLYLPAIIEPEYHFQSINVENQEHNPSSLLWWMRRVIGMRKRFRAFGCGALEMLYPDNPKVLAFLRREGEEILLVVVNLSRFSQVAHLDLSAYAGLVPEEVFSRNPFPVIRESTYVLTLGPHDYYWFLLRRGRESVTLSTEMPGLALKAGKPWHAVLREGPKERFFDLVLPVYLQRCRWFRGKARALRQITLVDSLPLGTGDAAPHLVLFQVIYVEGPAETYALPLAYQPLDHVGYLFEDFPLARVAPLKIGDEEGALFDAVYDRSFREALLTNLSRRKKVRSSAGELAGLPGSRLRRLKPAAGEEMASRVIKVEQSNSSILYGDRLFLKLYRQLEEGNNPDPEITRFLTEKARFPHVPPFAGTLEYRREGGGPMTVAMLQGFVANQGDAWRFTLDELSRFIERVLAHKSATPELCTLAVDCDPSKLPHRTMELLGSFYLEMAALMGQRTAEMHLALASNAQSAEWKPEPFSLLYQRSVYQSMRSLLRRAFLLLDQNLGGLKEEERERAVRLLKMEKEALAHLSRVRERKIAAMKIRIHGDYHLGQLLYTGKDFVIIDFEGEPARTLSERRLKRSPLRDVAGMIRSFHYAAFTASLQHSSGHPGDLALLDPWLESWSTYAGASFLRAYLNRLEDSPLLPREAKDLNVLLRAFLLEKAVYELGYELNNRPDWVSIPIKGIETILAGQEDEEKA